MEYLLQNIITNIIYCVVPTVSFTQCIEALLYAISFLIKCGFLFLAFSWFSIAEFGIAFANMGFHGTIIKDFYNLKLVAFESKSSSCDT